MSYNIEDVEKFREENRNRNRNKVEFKNKNERSELCRKCNVEKLKKEIPRYVLKQRLKKELNVNQIGNIEKLEEVRNGLNMTSEEVWGENEGKET